MIARASEESPNLGITEVLICAFIGGMMGAALGRTKGFSLKLQAQTALCQVQIERNTRAESPATRSASTMPVHHE